MTAGPADTAEASPVVETEVDIEAEDLLLEAAAAAIERCSAPSAVTAVRSARFLSNLLTVNLFIAAIVLKKWAEGMIPDVPKEPNLDPLMP